ncbi:MAG: permease-like cell division protein FtsX [Patescibacteria group bacterium]|nr:permease-like cell division protein FtsX [Patescibacteria group bacterium]
MILVTSLGRIISFSWKNIIRNAWIGLATVLVLVLALLSVNVLIGVNALASSAISILEKKIDVSVYFLPETPEAILDQARSYMASLPQTESVIVSTADQALEAFKERHSNDPSILDALNELDENPLGATMIIKASKTTDYPYLMEALNNPQFSFAIESKTYDDHTVAIDQVQQIAATIRYFGLILTVIFTIFSALIVYNAIRVAIYTQREEIGIMRLVGASNAFVRLPLIIDAIFFALLALLISAALIATIISVGEPYLLAFYDGADPGLKTYFTANFVPLVVGEGLVISLVVAMASWAAVGKYLKK